MAILIAVVAGTAGIVASTMVAKPGYAASGLPPRCTECKPPAIPGCFRTGESASSDTRITLQGVQILYGKLVCKKGTAIAGNPGIAGATITFTGSGVRPNAVAKTDSDGNYYMSGPEEPGTYNVQAHFSGATMRGPSGIEVFFTGSDSDIVTIDVK